MQKKNDIKFILGITLKLLIISTVTALLLSCVNALTADKIADNALKEKNAAIASIFPEADKNELYMLERTDAPEIYKVYDGDVPLGYAAEIKTLGFGGEMAVLVGVDTNGSVVGVRLISHSETPGLGNRVGETGYLAQYVGKDAAAIADGIDVITGSTISSLAIRDAVNVALSAHHDVFPIVRNGGAE